VIFIAGGLDDFQLNGVNPAHAAGRKCGGLARGLVASRGSRCAGEPLVGRSRVSARLGDGLPSFSLSLSWRLKKPAHQFDDSRGLRIARGSLQGADWVCA